ncbi:MAG: SCP2 sterol-binding domain-containing protein, partial [Gammaproteobacteria bacterium]|nr:SCP2 sterol-binding domain-containing protein [Gammaproteobacteria bacterium]
MFTELIEDIVNRILKLDPESAPKLRALESKVICLEFSGSEQRWCLKVNERGVSLVGDEASPDVTLQGSVIAFARLMLGDGLTVFQDHAVQIHGDVETGQAFQKIVKDFEFDPEEQMSSYIGDVAAYRLNTRVRQLYEWSREVRSNLARNLVETLQEERGVLAPTTRVRRFIDEVDEIRSEVERLEQRV